METRGVIKFLHLKGYSAQQIYDEMEAVYGDDCPSYSTLNIGKEISKLATCPSQMSQEVDAHHLRTMRPKLPDDNRNPLHPVPKEPNSALTGYTVHTSGEDSASAEPTVLTP